MPDFTLTDEGSVVLLRPNTTDAREGVETHIGSDNGYQPYWPTVLLEHRYADDVIDGILADGLEVEA